MKTMALTRIALHAQGVHNISELQRSNIFLPPRLSKYPQEHSTCLLRSWVRSRGSIQLYRQFAEIAIFEHIMQLILHHLRFLLYIQSIDVEGSLGLIAAICSDHSLRRGRWWKSNHPGNEHHIWSSQAWRKYLISGIDKNRCQNRKVSIESILESILTSARASLHQY